MTRWPTSEKVKKGPAKREKHKLNGGKEKGS